ncbi:hypothetical protein D3C72_2369830 [compost metagenome]
MPGAPLGGDELDDAAVAADEEVRRYAQAPQAFQPRVRAVIQRVQEQAGDLGAAELSRRQADVVQHQ